MPDDASHETLLRTLSEIQRRGAIGRTSISDAIAHSLRFVAAIPPDARSLVDLGAGGGLPALVIADRRRDLTVTAVERRAKRADLLRYGVRALGLTATVTVVDLDVDRFATSLDEADRFDVATARSFGPRAVVLEAARRLIHPGGTVLVSDPPAAVPTAGGDAGETPWRAWFTDDGTTDGIHRYRRLDVV